MICHLSWPCTAWFIASLSYTSPLAMTRLWSIKRSQCFWIVVLEKTLESSLDCKKIKLVSPKGKQSWILIGRTDTEAEAPILCSLNAKNWLWKRAWCWSQKEKRVAENEMVGWLTDSMDINLSKLPERVEDRGARHAVVHGVTKDGTWLSNWISKCRVLSLLNIRVSYGRAIS